MQTTHEQYRADRPVEGRRAAQRDLERLPPLVGRTMIAAIFVIAGLAKITDFEGTVGYMEAQGTAPAYWTLRAVVEVLAALAIIIEVGCGFALLLGAWTRVSALVLALYLIPVTVIFHTFWAYTGMERQTELFNFLKNLAIMGGLVYVAAYGAGEFGVDERRHRSALLEPRSLAQRLDRWFSASVKPWVRP